LAFRITIRLSESSLASPGHHSLLRVTTRPRVITDPVIRRGTPGHDEKTFVRTRMALT